MMIRNCVRINICFSIKYGVNSNVIKIQCCPAEILVDTQRYLRCVTTVGGTAVYSNIILIMYVGKLQLRTATCCSLEVG